MYTTLKQRIENRETVILDGAVGTRLQSMGVPMNNVAWAATALQTHPDTVRLMHQQYIAAGADIVTTNTYSSARHNLEPLGLGELCGELNRRAVRLAWEARDSQRDARPVAIAGSLSNFGIVIDGEEERGLHRYATARSEITAHQAQENLREQAELLAEAGADFLLIESTGGMAHRRWLADACLATGLPVWLGFKARLEDGEVRLGYSTRTPLAESATQIELSAFDVVSLFHTSIDATNAGLPVLREHWRGPVAVYPEADRSDYTAVYRDAATPNTVSPREFAEQAQRWVEDGVSIVGGCCGIDLPYIKALRETL